MSDNFLGQILYMGCNFAPRGYAFCNGQILAIQQNTALFSLLGTYYGGNGTTNFALPNLQGRIPAGTGTSTTGTSYAIGEQLGSAAVTLTTQQLPAHTHGATFTDASSLNAATIKSTLAQPTATAPLGRSVDSTGTALPLIYAPAGSTASVPLAGLNVAGSVTVVPTGGTQPHENRQPVQSVNAIIALQGVFPARN